MSDPAAVPVVACRDLRKTYRNGPLDVPVLLGVGVIGVVLAIARGQRADRVVGVVTVVATAAYLITPTGALGSPNKPLLFQANLRYVIPALVLTAVLAARSELGRRWPRLFATTFLILLIIKLASHDSWLAPNRYVVSAVVLGCIAVPVILLAPVPRHAGAVAVGAVVLALAIGYPLNRSYLDRRYAPNVDGQPTLYSALRSQTHVKVGVVGLPGIYPYLGPTYANEVSYVAHVGHDHAFLDYARCEGWRAAVVAGHYQFLVIETPPGNAPPPARAWTAANPAARPIYLGPTGAVFAVGAGFGEGGCAR